MRFGEHTLPPLASEDDRRRALVSIAALAAATGSPLLLVFDQIEAASRVADHAHLGKLIASAVQLVEHNVVGTAVVISALQDTYKIVKAAHLDASFVDRIENGVSPVTLRPPTPGELREIILKRTAYLLQLSEAAAEAETSWQMVPDWLLATTDSTMLRRALQDVRDYRNACRDAGRFLDQHEYRGKDAGRQGGSEAQQPELPAEEFEKLWQDAIDADLGTAANIPTSEKIALFQWLAENIGPELPQVSALTVESRTLEGSNPTRIFDLQFRDGDGVAFERWKIAVADAPNSQGQLRDQIVAFLDKADNALPGLLRLGAPLPRVRNDGEPAKSTTDVRGTQAGPPLADLLEAGGRIAPTDQRDWIRLRLAWQFVEQRRAAKGFTEWRVQRRFLLNMAGIGVMTKLLLPKTSNITPFPGPAGGRDNRTRETPRSSSSEALRQAQSAAHPADRADVLLGRTQAGKPVRWCLNKDADPALPNFGLMVSGDAGQGKTQIIKAIIAEVADLDCPVLVFDFKNDYGGPFAQAHGFESIDLNDGLPFNPLQLPPHGASGSQAINHIFEIAGLLAATLALGDRQKALLRQSLEAAYEDLQVPLRDWVDPDVTPAPSLGDIIERARAQDADLAAGLIDRLGLLHGKRLLPSSANARMRLGNLLKMRAILSFHNLPNDDQLKRALAELVLIQLQGHMLRGDQPRALRRLLVFDEAWRAADSKRLIQIAREGRAFGVGVVAGSQFADDLSSELTGNLASKLYLYNSDAAKRRKLVQGLLGTASGAKAAQLAQILSNLKQFDAAFANQQHTPYTVLRVAPYFERTGIARSHAPLRGG